MQTVVLQHDRQTDGAALIRFELPNFPGAQPAFIPVVADQINQFVRGLLQVPRKCQALTSQRLAAAIPLG